MLGNPGISHPDPDAYALTWKRRGRMNLFRRRQLLIAGSALLAVPARLARAQSKRGIRRIGVLMLTEASPTFRAEFSRGLRERGYVEGRDVEIDWRSAQGNSARADALAVELVEQRVEVIVALLSGAVRAASKATRTIPIVMAPAGSNFVKNLAQPEGNITGISGVSAQLSGKRLEILLEMIPGLRSVAVVLNGEDMVFGKSMLAETEAAARQRDIATTSHVVVHSDKIEPVFAAMAKARTTAAIVQPSLTIPRARAVQVAQLGMRHGVALVSASPEFVEAGGLTSYGADFPQIYRYAAVYVDKLLRGARPVELPVEQTSRFAFVVNAATAKVLGITLPKSILIRADRVIE